MILGLGFGGVAFVAIYLFIDMKRKQESRRGRYLRNKNLLNEKEDIDE